MVQSAFCVLIILVNVFVYRPMIKRLDADLKATRSLLVLLPSDVVRAVGILRGALADFTSRG
jgi:hypothetical protein